MNRAARRRFRPVPARIDFSTLPATRTEALQTIAVAPLDPAMVRAAVDDWKQRQQPVTYERWQKFEAMTAAHIASGDSTVVVAEE